MILIVGKNSKLIQAISDKLNKKIFCIISHKDLHTVNFEKFERVYLFSWSSRSLSENFASISLIPGDKLFFISTVAVFSLHVQKQWANYPNWKLQCEEMSLAKGGKVIRLGVIFSEVEKGLVGHYFKTTLAELVEVLEADNLPQIYNCFSVSHSTYNLHLFQLMLFTLYSRFYLRLSQFGILDMCFSTILKLIGLSRYSYTHASNLFATEVLRIGYGAVGCSIPVSSTELILYSGKEDSLLFKDGFIGTRIGYNKNGLNKLWHGAYIHKSGNQYFKRVKSFVPRPSTPTSGLQAHAELIKNNNGKFAVTIDSCVQNLQVFARDIKLCAGALENARLISGLMKSPIVMELDDHEIGYIGTVALEECISNGYVKKIGPLIVGRKVFTCFQEPSPYIVDFRPYCGNKLSGDMSFYNDSSLSIIKKLIQKFTWARVNEAVFNRFGVSVMTSRMTVFIQVVSRNCIRYENGKLLRKREKFDFDVILEGLNSTFASFKIKDTITLVDGHHIKPSRSTIKVNEVKEILEYKNLYVSGYTDWYELDAFHHTFGMKQNAQCYFRINNQDE